MGKLTIMAIFNSKLLNYQMVLLLSIAGKSASSPLRLISAGLAANAIAHLIPKSGLQLRLVLSMPCTLAKCPHFRAIKKLFNGGSRHEAN